MIGEDIILDSNALTQGFLGGALAGLAIFMVILVALFAIGLYVYHALAWQKIGKNQKYKYPWLSWIPFANISMIFQMGGFHWAWVFLFLLPVLGWIAIMVLLAISMWRIFEKAKYPGWLGLSYALIIIPYLGMFFSIAYLVVIGIVAWENKGFIKTKTKLKK